MRRRFGARCVLPLVILAWWHPLSAQIEINPGLGGAWFNPETPGQGFLIDVIDERRELFIGWFTYAQASSKVGASEHRWLTAQGSYDELGASLTLFSTSGGGFNSSQAVASEPIGQAQLSFLDCARAVFSFALDEGPADELVLVRLSPDGLCREFDELLDLPTFFLLTADASGEDEDGNTAECHVQLIYELSQTQVSSGLIEYLGIAGGEVGRTVQDSTGAGFAFFADFFVPDARARVFDQREVVLDGPGKGVDDSRLYLNLARFTGRLEPDGTATGDWTCGPFDIDVGGFVDTRLTVRGRWQVMPLSPGTPVR